MHTTTAFGVYVLDAGHQLYLETRDYEEAVALCRSLVEDDGYAAAEVWLGVTLCYSVTYRQGQIVVSAERHADDAIADLAPVQAAPRSRPSAAADREVPTPVMPLAPDTTDGPAPTIFGDDPDRPVHWLGA